MAKTTTQEIIQTINYHASDLGETQSYSGRCMYGKKCLGIVTDESPLKLLVKLTCAVVSELLENAPARSDLYDDLELINDVKSLLRDVQSDSMGLGTVVYFPSIEYINT